MVTTHRTPVFVLSAHAPYACGRTGVCCASGWDIPIDEPGRRRIALAIEQGSIAAASPDAPWCHDAADLPSPDTAILARQASGDCVFLDRSSPARCLVQSACGHDAMPLACRQFPRVTMADDRGLHVTLSHYCPTAAGLLWRDDNRSLEFLESPPGWSAGGLVPGLDARGQWPPLLRPGVLMTYEAWTQWERFCVGTCARPDLSSASMLGALAGAADAIRRWTPASGPLEARVNAVLDEWGHWSPARAPALDEVRALGDWGSAWDAVPERRASLPASPPAAEVVRARELIDGEPQVASRFLAAKCVASWAAYQCHGVRAFVASVRMAAHVLLVETARGSEVSPRARVREAVRRADLLLLHLAESAALARAWDQAEMNGPTRD